MSFIFSDKDGQVFCDLGAGRYTKDYFDESKRYDIFCNSSFGHSVPIIDGEPQSAGKRFLAKLTYENGIAVCDLSKAYDCHNLISFTRKAVINDNSVILTDDFSFRDSASVTGRFVSKRQAIIKDGQLIFGDTKLCYPKDKVTLKVSEAKHTPHEYDKEDVSVYCYDFILNDGVTEICFEIITE